MFSFFRHICRYLAVEIRIIFDRKNSFYYRILFTKLDINPSNIEFYKLALIHKSATVLLSDNQGETFELNNERLEFLGDSVISTIISDYIFIMLPYYKEGDLTKLRSKIVGRDSLNNIALKMGIDEVLVTKLSSHFSKADLYGSALEALVGAMYLDKGYNITNNRFITNFILPYINLESLITKETDFKSRILEYCQKRRSTVYFSNTIVSVTATSTNFISRLYIDSLLISIGYGGSKKIAEQCASSSALMII